MNIEEEIVNEPRLHGILHNDVPLFLDDAAMVYWLCNIDRFIDDARDAIAEGHLSVELQDLVTSHINNALECKDTVTDMVLERNGDSENSTTYH